MGGSMIELYDGLVDWRELLGHLLKQNPQVNYSPKQDTTSTAATEP